MNERYEPGAPTVADITHLEEIRLPVVYLDWNVAQYLSRDEEAVPLLNAILDVTASERLLAPFTAAHLLDATAMWESADRAGRLRHMVFLDGLSGSWMWRHEDERHVVEHTTMYRAAKERGLFDLMADLRMDAPEAVAHFDEQHLKHVAEALAQGRNHAAAAKDPKSREIILEMSSILEETHGGGIPSISDAGSRLMKMFAPVLKATRSFMAWPEHREVHPMDAGAAVDARLRAVNTEWSIRHTLDLARGQRTSTAIYENDIGPCLLGYFGYFPDPVKKIHRCSPGFLADGQHASFALDSAIFITGDECLAMRVDAWAHYIGGGLGNGGWPVVSVVKPGQARSFERNADLVRGIADKFSDVMNNVFARNEG